MQKEKKKRANVYETRNPKLYDKDFLINEHHKKLKDVKTIAKEIGCSVTMVRNALTRLNIQKLNGHTLKYPLLINLTKEKLKLYANDCLAPKHVAEMYECPLHTIRQKYKTEKVEPFINDGQKYVDPRLYCENWMERQIKDGKSAFEISNILDVHVQTVWVWLNKFSINFPKSQGISHQEKELLKFIEDNYTGKIITNTKKVISPYELDIYIPELNLAIEYNGMFYHSYNKIETKEERNYHKMKTDMCLDKNIQLIHILEYEWLMKNEVVKSFLLNKLNKVKSIGARKTEIVFDISNEEIKKFYNKYHLQGYTTACKINIGLKYKGELISCMSFSKPRFSKKYDWELMRFSTKSGFRISGGASKLLKAFLKNEKGTIISYADSRYSNGNLYETIGFIKEDNDIPVRYQYVKGNTEIYNRMSFQKKKLPKILDKFDPEKTEAENLFINGYRRMWDCGKTVWIYK